MTTETRRSMRVLAALVAALMTLTLTTVAAGSAGAVASAQAAAAGGTVAKNASGKMKSTVVGKTAGGGTLGGTFTPLKFAVKDGVPIVKGVLDGVITSSDGTKSRFTAVRSLVVKKIDGHKLDDATLTARQLAACEILNLVLGPLDLNVLGLEVHLKQVVLDIIAVPGAGNLLGNLLCAVAALLDGGLGGILSQLVDLLNQILGQLGLGV